MDDASTHTYSLLWSDLQAQMGAIGGTINEYALASSALGWNLSPLVGKTVVQVVFNGMGGAVAFAAAPTQPDADSSIKVFYNLDLSNPAVYPGIKMVVPGAAENVTPIGAVPYTLGLDFRIELKLRSSPANTVDVTIPLDAASLIAGATDPTAQDSNTVLGNALLTPYLGWLTAPPYFVVNLASNYSSAPSMTPPSLFASFGLTTDFFRAFGPDINPLDTASWTPGAGFETVIEPNGFGVLGVVMELQLFPLDVPATLPLLLFTEPYELRHRNLPAFRFYFTYGGQQEDPLLAVKMFVSQGKVDTSPQEWLWTPCPVDVLDNTGFLKEQVAASLHIAIDGISGLPAYYGGAMLIVPKEFTGPWNYIKFLLYTPTGQDVSDLNAGIVNILANAREVI
jgi:hypothetical protein